MIQKVGSLLEKQSDMRITQETSLAVGKTG